MQKLLGHNREEARKQIFQRAAEDHVKATREMMALQIVAYVMCGGGGLGKMAGKSPETFQIDLKTLPFPSKTINSITEILAIYAEALGYCDGVMPDLPIFEDTYGSSLLASIAIVVQFPNKD
jgi:hypothetical protein